MHATSGVGCMRAGEPVSSSAPNSDHGCTSGLSSSSSVLCCCELVVSVVATVGIAELCACACRHAPHSVRSRCLCGLYVQSLGTVTQFHLLLHSAHVRSSDAALTLFGRLLRGLLDWSDAGKSVMASLMLLCCVVADHAMLRFALWLFGLALSVHAVGSSVSVSCSSSDAFT